MKYMGSKNRIAKHLIPIMVAEADKIGITQATFGLPLRYQVSVLVKLIL